MKPKRRLAGWIGAGIAIAVSVPLLANVVVAADHQEAPGAQDPEFAADIADFFAWNTEGGNVVAVITFAPGQAATFDNGVLYGIHFDTNDDQTADNDIWIRFGQNMAGDSGMQVLNLPGEDDAVVGAVEEALMGTNGGMAWAGLRDDPFFFDGDGYAATLMTGDLSFDPMNDSFAGGNVTAIVVEFAAGGLDNTAFDVWATTGRLP